MKLTHLFENNAEHFDALNRTGFFGAAGAGCVFLARDTGNILIAHRSEAVEQPGTWGGWGGAINRGEDPVAAVRREVSEEAGYHEHYELEPLFIFEKGTFKYYNFLVVVDHEFTPELDWETQGFKWCKWGQWPQPLHFGLISLFGDAPSAAKIQKAISEFGVEESVGAVGSVSSHYMRPQMTMTAAERQEAQQAGWAWQKDHPRAAPQEIAAACPYDKTRMPQRRVWIMAATPQP